MVSPKIEKQFWSNTLRILLTTLGLLAGLSGASAWADRVGNWDTASTVMAAGLPALAGLATLGGNDAQGTRQLVLSTGSTLAATELLKHTVHARRPDGSDNKSFPSGHTAVAFSAVGFMDRRYGEQWGQRYGQWAVPALYGVAALTGVARVEANKHHWGDVLAGAAIGYGAARFWSEPVRGGQLSVVPAPRGLAVGWAAAF